MTNAITILAIAVLAISVPSAFACSEGNVQHWINLEIVINNDLIHDSEPTINGGGAIFLPIPTMGSEIFASDIRNVIISDRLNELGYTDEEENPVTVFDIGSVNLFPGNVGYSTICKDGVMEVIGGMLIQPDSTAMFLAYGIANAIWIAPTAAGLAAGIYFTKSKWKR